MTWSTAWRENRRHRRAGVIVTRQGGGTPQVVAGRIVGTRHRSSANRRGRPQESSDAHLRLPLQDCEHEFEIHQSFSEDALTECPECQGRSTARCSAVGISFKGSGFYKTDSRGTRRRSSRPPGSSDSPARQTGSERRRRVRLVLVGTRLVVLRFVKSVSVNRSRRTGPEQRRRRPRVVDGLLTG